MSGTQVQATNGFTFTLHQEHFCSVNLKKQVYWDARDKVRHVSSCVSAAAGAPEMQLAERRRNTLLSLKG